MIEIELFELPDNYELDGHLLRRNGEIVFASPDRGAERILEVVNQIEDAKEMTKEMKSKRAA